MAHIFDLDSGSKHSASVPPDRSQDFEKDINIESAADKAKDANSVSICTSLPTLEFHYPRYEELPDKLMFLDEIVDYIGRVHSCIPLQARNGKYFTTAMASNYIKSGLTKPPIGKKYNKDHLCLMLFAASNKMLFSAEQVIRLSKRLFNDRPVDEVNDEFAECVETALTKMMGTGFYYGDSCARQNPPKDVLIDAVACAWAAHLLALMEVVDQDIDDD